MKTDDDIVVLWDVPQGAKDRTNIIANEIPRRSLKPSDKYITKMPDTGQEVWGTAEFKAAHWPDIL